MSLATSLDWSNIVINTLTHFGTDLVSTLTSLQVNNFPHVESLWKKTLFLFKNKCNELSPTARRRHSVKHSERFSVLNNANLSFQTQVDERDVNHSLPAFDWLRNTSSH